MEAARPLNGYTQNRYDVTSTMLCWSKQVIRPAQIQGRGIKLCFLMWEGHAYLGRGKTVVAISGDYHRHLVSIC